MGGSANSTTLSSNGSTPGLRAISRFQTEIQAKGTFKPGEPIRLSVSVQAKFAAQNATIRLFLPEIDALKNSKAGRPAVIPVGVPLAPHASWSQGLGQGQVFTRQQTITVEKPGYYHVLVSVQGKDVGKFTKGGMPVINSDWKDVWLWIAPAGGKLTKNFDSTLFSSEMRPQAGPLTKQTEAPQVQYGQESPNSASGSITVQVNYRDKSQFQPIYGPLKDVQVKYFLSSGGVVDQTGTEQTDDQGVASVPCPEGENSYTIKIYNENDDLKVYDGPHGSNATTFAVSTTGDLGSDCGHTIVINSQNSYLFTDMNQVIATSRSFFQHSRGQISVYRKLSGDISAYYGGNADYISIAANVSSGIGSPYGQFSMAHEYGHALQEKALGGTANYSCSSSGHSIFGAYNLQCAYFEGFADYHADIASTNSTPYFAAESDTSYLDTPYYIGCLNFDQYGNCTQYASNPDGPIVEGAVAAFLYDLTDPANESFDNIADPGFYIADAIKKCRVKVNGINIHPNGIDHLIACLQGSTPDYYGHFSTRNTYPSGWSWSAPIIQPPGWSATDVRTLWYHDLYDESYTAPPPPPSTPQNMTITNPTAYGQSPQLAWDAVSGADQYDLYRCVSLSGNTCSSYSGDYGPMNDVTLTSWPDNETTIENPLTYPSCAQVGYYVKAANAGGESPASNIVTLNCVDPPDHPHIVTTK